MFLLWMSWSPQASASLGPPPPWGPAAFVGFYLLLVAGVRVWSELLGRRIVRDNLDRSLRGFGRVLMVVRFLVPTWFGVGVFLLGWGELVHQLATRWWSPLQVPSMLLATFPAFATWAGLLWSRYPADRSIREHTLLDELEADLPVHAPPTFRSYFASNVRLQLLFTAVPVVSIIAVRDLIFTAVRLWRGPEAAASEAVEFAAMLLSTAVVFVFAPEILRRVLQTQPLPDSPLRRRLEALCRRVGMRYRDILLWRTQNNMGNAAVMGIVPRLRYILLSDLLLERMDDEQIEAVFAHEVGHVVHRHMAWYIVIFLIFFLGASVVDQFLPKQLPAWAGVPQAALDVLMLLGGLVAFLFYFGFLSRRFERQADVYAARTIEAHAREAAAKRSAAPLGTFPAAPAAPAALAAGPDFAHQSHVGEYGATVFASALHRVALMNNIPLGPRRRPRRGLVRRMSHALDGFVESLHNWLHGSIHHRMAYLRGLSTDPAATFRFDRFMLGLYCTLLFALFACAAFVVASGAR